MTESETSRRRFCIVTSYDPSWQELGELTYQNKLAYAERHDYTLICTLADGTRWRDGSIPHPAWTKVTILRDLLSKHEFEWHFWTDADAIVIDQSRTLEEFVSFANGKWPLPLPQLLISADPLSINCGNFLIRNTPEMLTLLNEVWDWGERHEIERSMSPWEQRAFHAIKGDGRIPGIKIVPQRWFNAYDPALYDPSTNGCYEEGDFLLHYPGGTYEWKLEQIRKRLSSME